MQTQALVVNKFEKLYGCILEGFCLIKKAYTYQPMYQGFPFHSALDFGILSASFRELKPDL